MCKISLLLIFDCRSIKKKNFIPINIFLRVHLELFIMYFRGFRVLGMH